MSLVPSATAALVHELPSAISRAGTGRPTRTVIRAKEGHPPSGGSAFAVPV